MVSRLFTQFNAVQLKDVKLFWAVNVLLLLSCGVNASVELIVPILYVNTLPEAILLVISVFKLVFVDAIDADKFVFILVCDWDNEPTFVCRVEISFDKDVVVVNKPDVKPFI